MRYMPENQVFWYLNNSIKTPPLRQNISTEIAIIGGGMAGLSAAQAFINKGCKVVLIEKNYCGAGASGKSSGFITPDSELSLFELEHMFGAQAGKKIWKLIGLGVGIISDNIKKYAIECDYQIQDTLILANTERAFINDIKKEYDKRKQAELSSILYTQNEIQNVIGSSKYVGGISYGGTFGIRAYQYCLAMKKVLQEMGAHIFEDTPALEIKEKKVITPHAVISAKHIILCTDYFEPAAHLLWDKIYHVQTFLMLSAPLSEAQVAHIFPAQRFMVWDTDMIYHYFRLTGDNRLMLGGSDILYTYAKTETYNCARIAKKLMNYFSEKFPMVSLQFEYC